MKLRLFLLLSCLYLVVASREQPWGDAHVVYDTTQNLVDQGRLDVSLGGPPQFYATRNGKKYGVFPLGNVVAMAPGYLAFKVLRHLPGVPHDLLFRLTSHLSPSLLIAGVAVLFFSLAQRYGASRRTALWLALALGTSTVLLVYARAPFSEALQALTFTWVVERGLTLGRRLTLRGALFLGVAAGLLFNTKLVYALCLPVVPAYLIVCHRRDWRRLLAAFTVAAIPAAALVAVAIAHNHLKTGTLLDSGYAIPEGVFSGNTYAALHGFFLSTGKSVFLYSPLLVVALFAWPSFLREHRREGLFILAFTGLCTLANAKFRYWHADYCWGPRLLVPLTAVWLLPLASWIGPALERGRRAGRALALGAVVGSGLFVQLLGASFYWDHWIRIAIAVKDQTNAAGWYTEDLHHCHFIPQFSPILGHAWLLGHKVRGDDDPLADPPWRRVIPTRVTLANEYAGARPDWWVLDWAERTQPAVRGYLGGILAFHLAVALLCAWGLRRRLAEEEAPQPAGSST